MKNSPFVIAVVHTKGGVGKSTLCCHIAAAMKMLQPTLRIGLIDLDILHSTSYNFFYSKNLLDLVVSGQSAASIDIALQEELDVLILDAAAGDGELMKAAIQHANLLITPVQYSFVDIDAIVSVRNNRLFRGPLTDIVNDHKTSKLKSWFVIYNRLPLISLSNKYTETIATICHRLHAKLFYVYDRAEYRAAFENRQTVNEIINPPMTNGQIAARKEMNAIANAIFDIMNYE